jgi:cytoplasmic iron level regulating protein YaaA (DUF328/UPF0246 family)
VKDPKGVTLVSCSGPKLKVKAPASKLYTSDLFKKSKTYALQARQPWAILSAKYGLVLPNQAIAPYDLTLAKMSAAERRTWGKKVRDQIRKTFSPGTHFVILAGKLYVDPFRDLADYSFEDLLKGKQIGQRLSWLKAMTGG